MISIYVKRVVHASAPHVTTDDIKHVMAGAALCWAVLATSAKAGMYRWQPMNTPRALGWAAMYILLRALVEEAIFRAVMLPHPKVDPVAFLVPQKFAIAGFAPLLLFVAWHAVTTQRPAAAVLSDTRFLGTVALVGAACSWAYWVSGGALWAAVVMHVLVVYPWMVLLGGHRKLHTPTPIQVAGARDLAPGGPTETKKE